MKILWINVVPYNKEIAISALESGAQAELFCPMAKAKRRLLMHNKIFLLSTTAFFFLCLFETSHANAEIGSLVVKVLDENNKPLEINSVQIWVGSKEKGTRGYTYAAEPTEKPGVHRVFGIPVSRNYALRISKAGYAPFRKFDIEIGPGEDNEILCKLSKGGNIEGYVTNNAGNPVSGIPVVINAILCRRDVVTDKNGRFIANHLPNIEYSILAEPKSNSSYEVTVFKGRVPCGAKDIHIVLKEKASTQKSKNMGNQTKVALPIQDTALIDKLSKASLQSRISAVEKLLNQPAPPLVIEKWYNGDFWQLNLKNRVILLDFWGVWCGPCKRQIPVLKNLFKEYSKQGLVVIGVHTQLKKKDIPEFISKEAVPYIVGVDYQNKTAEMYHVSGYPSMFIIDRKGLIRAVDPEKRQLQKLLLSLLQEHTK